LSEHKEKLDANTISEIEKALEDAKAIDSNSSLEDVQAKSSALSTASMKIGEAMYKKTGSEGAAESPKAESNEAEAEYTEKK
jgi:molecular chaperone DnaK